MVQGTWATKSGTGEFKSSHAEISGDQVFFHSQSVKGKKRSRHLEILVACAVAGFMLGEATLLGGEGTVSLGIALFGFLVIAIVGVAMWWSLREKRKRDWWIESADDRLRFRPGVDVAPFELPRESIEAVETTFAESGHSKTHVVLLVGSSEGVQSMVLHETADPREATMLAMRFANSLSVPYRTSTQAQLRARLLSGTDALRPLSKSESEGESHAPDSSMAAAPMLQRVAMSKVRGSHAEMRGRKLIVRSTPSAFDVTLPPTGLAGFAAGFSIAYFTPISEFAFWGLLMTFLGAVLSLQGAAAGKKKRRGAFSILCEDDHLTITT